MFKKISCLFSMCGHITRKTIYPHLFIFLQIILISSGVQAKENAHDALNAPVGSTLARIGLGVASNGDYSVVDINPAILAAIEKQYSVFGSINMHSGVDMFEAGVMDTVFTSFATVLTYRQTTKSTSSIDRLIRLGTAYQIPDTHLSLGVSGTYTQEELIKWNQSERSGGALGVGALYQLESEKISPIFIGFSVLNIFDRFQDISYNLGLSKDFMNNLLSFHIDGSILQGKQHGKIASGIDIKVKKFFYLRGSAGWDFQDQVLPIGGGIYFNGPRLKAFYSIATHQVNTPEPWHSVGLILTL